MFPVRVNFHSIAKASDVTESGAAFVLKQLLLAMTTAVKKEVSIKLNLKVGFIKVNQSGSVSFLS